jgi:hypothetical protein
MEKLREGPMLHLGVKGKKKKNVLSLNKHNGKVKKFYDHRL